MSSFHDLPAPIRDSLTLECDQIVRYPRVSVSARYWGGARDSEGVFARDPDYGPVDRSITGDEFTAFCEWAKTRGAVEDVNSGVLYTDHDVHEWLAAREYRERGIVLPEAA